MSEWLTGLLLAAAEFGLLVSVAFGVFLYVRARCRRHDHARALELVARLKQGAAAHEADLITVLKDAYGLGETEASDKARVLIDQEKSLYRKVMRMFLGRDRTGISRFDEDLRQLLQAWRELGETPAEAGAEAGTGASAAILRKENQRLRAQNAKLESDLAQAMATMENMLAEYASMYEGGRKEGEQRMKNEMFRLRQALESGESPPNDDIPELTDIADPHPR